MNRTARFLAASTLGFALAFAAALPRAASAQPADAADTSMDAVAFMVGCWRQGPADGLREYYAAPAANMMTGLSQFWRGGRIVDWEFHRIDASPEGPVLTPHPRGVASVSFRPAVLEPGHVVWQNLEHDFPQRLIYRRTGDSLTVRAEAGEGAEARRLEWAMTRVPCVP